MSKKEEKALKKEEQERRFRRELECQAEETLCNINLFLLSEKEPIKETDKIKQLAEVFLHQDTILWVESFVVTDINFPVEPKNHLLASVNKIGSAVKKWFQKKRGILWQ